MGVADRLYETACDCRDLEERLDRVLRENAEQRRRLDHLEKGSRELLAQLEGADLPAGAELAALDLKHQIR